MKDEREGWVTGETVVHIDSLINITRVKPLIHALRFIIVGNSSGLLGANTKAKRTVQLPDTQMKLNRSLISACYWFVGDLLENTAQ